VAAATAVQVMRKEVAALDPSRFLATAGPLTVFLARAREIPAVLTELGRLREESFRHVGEGTGMRVDLDWFDLHYDHLVLWNREKEEVAGGYRLVRTPEVLKRFGATGLYTNTLFQYKREFFERMGNAIELGRSFIAPSYQKQYGPLLLLWKSILRYIKLHPGYNVLFGAVSISSEFSVASRRLIAECMYRAASGHPLRKLVKPRNPLRRKPGFRGELDRMPQMVRNFEGLSTVVNDLENGARDIPVLLRQYNKLGGVVLAFNLDPDFSDALDGLIVLDLRNTDPAMLRRYQ